MECCSVEKGLQQGRSEEQERRREKQKKQLGPYLSLPACVTLQASSSPPITRKAQCRLCCLYEHASITSVYRPRRHKGNTFELEISEHLRMSRTRNVAEIKRDQVDNSRPQDPPPPIDVAKVRQAEYEIDRIIGWREHNGTAEFEVKWTG